MSERERSGAGEVSRDVASYNLDGQAQALHVVDKRCRFASDAKRYAVMANRATVTIREQNPELVGNAFVYWDVPFSPLAPSGMGISFTPPEAGYTVVVPAVSGYTIYATATLVKVV